MGGGWEPSCYHLQRCSCDGPTGGRRGDKKTIRAGSVPVEAMTSTCRGAMDVDGAGIRQARRRRRVQLYLANVTSWTAHAQDYLVQPSSDLSHCHVMCIAEHHRRGAALVEVIKKLRRLGWSTTAEAAAETGTAVVREGPGHGGVWVAVRSHLQSSGLSVENKLAVQQAEHQGLSTQWTARQLRTKGQTILVVVLYLAPGQGLTGTSLVTLTEVGAYIKAHGLPFVLTGDFNMEGGELEIVLMERFLRGRWVRPASPVPGRRPQGDRPGDGVGHARSGRHGGVGSDGPLGSAAQRPGRAP